MKKSQPKRLDFPKALKSFLGYLEGTQKAAHTIKNYKLDLIAFHSYLSERDRKPVRYETLGEKDLELFHTHLKTLGLKTNTRRRKLLTAHRFVRFLSQRNLLQAELPTKLVAPHKIERIPFTVRSGELLEAIRQLPSETLLDRRNRALLWTLAETGCLVSEVTRLRYDDWKRGTQTGTIAISGKSPRLLPVSLELLDEIEALQRTSSAQQWVFLGFNKHGPLGGPISPRGVEILVRHYSTGLAIPKLTPRIFRHSAVLSWFENGLEQAEIQKRLGLKTDYAFRAYAFLLKKSSGPAPGTEEIEKRS